MGPDKDKWIESVNKEHERMVQDRVFQVVDAEEAISQGQKAITSTWTMKKKSDGTYCARLVARGFQQQEGLHYNIAAISSPVTSNTSICMVLTIMEVAGYAARVIDVKAAFLKGELENNEEIYIKIPKGFEKFYPKQDSWLQIKKPIYGLKQSGLYYYKKAKQAMQINGFERSKADPCLFYARRNKCLVIWVTWVDDNMVIAPPNIMDQDKDMMKNHFECDDLGKMTEYIGCKIKRSNTSRAIKITQLVLVQSLKDEFNLPDGVPPTTRAKPGTTITKQPEEDPLNNRKHTNY